MPEGGVGFSWFNVELTSEHVPVAGEGGVGYSWFTIDLTSEDVPVEPGGPTPGAFGALNVVKRVRRRVEEDVFPGRFTVVESEEARFNGLVVGYEDSVFAGIYRQVETSVQSFEATFATSTLRARIQQEEEELLCLMD